ncbi:MAG: hypothetical protein D5S03_05910 [Desulfonatronospira sp. MSAO_Bac3]|nr:MAG: hypothetical protein D5S03_05910 [Desulfonatronospira sp. MSAO_Bac3]
MKVSCEGVFFLLLNNGAPKVKIFVTYPHLHPCVFYFRAADEALPAPGGSFPGRFFSAAAEQKNRATKAGKAN